MPFVEWRDSYSVGISDIDVQHKGLVRMINDLHDAMKEGRSKDIIQKTLDGLYKYTETHFYTEELYFQKYGYPQTSEHILEHGRFTMKVKEFIKDHEKGKVLLSMDVLRYLREWLLGHIQNKDQAYAPYLRGKGAI